MPRDSMLAPPGCVCFSGIVRPLSHRSLELAPSQVTVAGGTSGLYAWIRKDEADSIRELRSCLTDNERLQLQGEPEDIRSDLMMCRFLRGNGNRVPRALKALRNHLKYRRENQKLLIRARAKFPPKQEVVNLDLCLHGDEFNHIVRMLQLPARLGTNDGMPMSCVSLGILVIKLFHTMDDEHLHEWFVSAIEMRSLCLHNQSWREMRMAKVAEVRDCANFSWSSLLRSPLLLRKLAGVIKTATLYPEVMGTILFFNLEPGSRCISLIKNLLPAEMQKKMIFADREDWESVMCAPNGLSPSSFPRLTKYVDDIKGTGWQVLTSSTPQLVRSIEIEAKGAFSWLVQLDGQERTPKLNVSVQFFSNNGTFPSMTKCCKKKVLTGGSSMVPFKGSFTAAKRGAVILSIELQGKTDAAVYAALAHGDHGVEDVAVRHGSQHKVAPRTRERRTMWLGASVILVSSLVVVGSFLWWSTDGV